MLQPLRYGPQQYRHLAVFKRHFKYLQLGVVMGVGMGVAGACCSVSSGLIPFMGPKVPG